MDALIMKICESSTYKRTIKNIANSLPNNRSSVLITGACGLIGSCLVDTLLEAGYCVYALDLKKERLVERFGPDNENLHFISHDICQPLDNTFEFDYIIHSASFADPKSYALYPSETILVNVVGTKNVLDYCKNHLKTRVLFTSTFEVYGHQEDDYYSEDDFGLLNFNSLRSCYPESKRTSEVLLRSYCDEYDVDGVIVRLSSIYGPTMLKNDSKAHAQFLFKGINKESIVLKSSGEQKRTYTYVLDAVSAILFVMFNGKTGEAYNVANTNSIVSIAQLARLIGDVCGVDVIYGSPDEIEKKGFSKPQNCILRTDKLVALGWKPHFDIKDGIIETIQIMKEITE